MRRVLPLVVAGVLAGCGGDKAPEPAQPDPAADRREIAGVVDRYYEAVADADAAAVCAALSAPLQRDVLAQEGEPCPEAIAPELRGATAGERRELRSIRVQEATIDGDRGTATLTSDFRLASLPNPLQVRLRRGSGGWRIAERPPAPPPRGIVDRCVTSALVAFDAGKIHPFWRRQSREALALFMSRLCYVGERRGLVTERGGFDTTPRGRRELAKLAEDIIEELDAAGRIKGPEGHPQPDRIVG